MIGCLLSGSLPHFAHPMSSYKVFLLSGAAAFVSSEALADEFQGKNIPFHASAVVGFRGAAAHTQLSPAGDSKTAKCGTGFGAELQSPDGLISWNDTTNGTGIDSGAAADFTYSVKTKVKQALVKGFGGTNPEQYNVTFYKNDRAGGVG